MPPSEPSTQRTGGPRQNGDVMNATGGQTGRAARRVLLVHEPPDGGVAEHVRLLALGLREHGYEAEVAGPPESVTAESLREHGVTVHTVPFVRAYSRPDAELKVAPALARLAGRPGITLVHAHSSKAGVHGRVAARFARVPSVYSPHCFGFIGPVSSKRKLAATAIERALAPLSGAILCVCEAERREALEQKIASPRKLITVMQGIPAPATDVPGDPSLAALRGGGPLVGAVNVLRPQKRNDVLIDAIPRVWARVPEARFAIVGNGALEPDLRARAVRCGVEPDERFQMLPFTAPSIRYLQELDLFVLPSDWEALPIGVLEAMAAGVPQVVTAVGGNAEAVSADSGRVIAPDDPQRLADVLVQLLGDAPERVRLAAGSRARHRDRFTVERMVGEIAAVYDEQLSRR
jgi:glycosyltransferase involved in cell wall biosynthesis